VKKLIAAILIACACLTTAVGCSSSNTGDKNTTKK
jgi:hypothetical protein